MQFTVVKANTESLNMSEQIITPLHFYIDKCPAADATPPLLALPTAFSSRYINHLIVTHNHDLLFLLHIILLPYNVSTLFWQ